MVGLMKDVFACSRHAVYTYLQAQATDVPEATAGVAPSYGNCVASLDHLTLQPCVCMPAGLDTCLSIMKVLHDGLGDSKYRPCPLLQSYVDAGWLGQKVGHGVYQYDQEHQKDAKH
jgi:hypothetical protein